MINGRAMELFPTDDMTYREAMLLGLHGDNARRSCNGILPRRPTRRRRARLA
jgi:hypothetical protein